MKKYINEFKDFIATGDLVTIAVGLIIALKVKDVIDQFMSGVVNPLIAGIFGKTNFDDVGSFRIGSATNTIPERSDEDDHPARRAGAAWRGHHRIDQPDHRRPRPLPDHQGLQQDEEEVRSHRRSERTRRAHRNSRRTASTTELNPAKSPVAWPLIRPRNVTSFASIG